MTHYSEKRSDIWQSEERANSHWMLWLIKQGRIGICYGFKFDAVCLTCDWLTVYVLMVRDAFNQWEKSKWHSTHSEAHTEESLHCQTEAVQRDVDWWWHRESFKERCLFSHGTSLSIWLFILRYMLRIHRCSFNTRRIHTHLTHSHILLTSCSLLHFSANRLFCSSTYSVPAHTSALGFYLWAQASLCARLPNVLTRDMPLLLPPKNPPQPSLRCV